MSKRIVLLGCGYTSVWCYKALRMHAASFLKQGKAEVVLLSDTDFHSFHGFTGEFLSGYLSLDFRRTPYQEIMEGVRFIKGRVVQVNQLKQEITYETQDSTDFYTLVP